MVAQTGLSALKWKVLLRGQGVIVPYAKLIRTCLLANFVNLFSPGVLGGDAYRSIALRAHTGGVARSLPSIIADRATGLAVLVGLAATGVSLYFVPAAPALAAGLILLTALLGYALLVAVIDPLLHRLIAGREHSLTVLLSGILVALRPTRALGTAFAIALVFQLNTIFIVYLWSAGLHLSASVVQLFLIVPAVYLLEMVPISVSGVGLREGVYAVLFSFFGLPPEQGLALGLLTSIMRYVVNAIGALIWFVPDGSGLEAASVPGRA